MDRKEYEQITTLYLDSVYRVALSGCGNKSDAEDVVQNTFIKLWEREEFFADMEHARKWLIRVAVNECHSLWRAPWKKKTVYFEEMTKEPIFSHKERSDLYDAVMDLPVKYRQVVHLYYFEEYSVKEIAEIMKLSETAVQTRLLRARQKLKETLKGAWK